MTSLRLIADSEIVPVLEKIADDLQEVIELSKEEPVDPTRVFVAHARISSLVISIREGLYD